MVLAHRGWMHPKPTNAKPPSGLRDYADSGKHLGPLPPPGVYAAQRGRHPALLPGRHGGGVPVSRAGPRARCARAALADDIEELNRQIGGRPTRAERGRGHHDRDHLPATGGEG